MTAFKMGQANVFTGNHEPEFFARRAMEKILYIADTTPEPIRTQAYAYRDQIYALVLDGINRAIQSDRNNRN